MSNRRQIVLLFPGDRVLIKGTTQDSFRPFVVADNITVLHHGTLPPAVPATFDQLIRGELDSRLVTVYGVVRECRHRDEFRCAQQLPADAYGWRRDRRCRRRGQSGRARMVCSTPRCW